MPSFVIEFVDTTVDRHEVRCATVDEARNEAIVLLGGYLQEHPDFAYSKHWRVDLRDDAGRLLLHVIVATVEAARTLNFASFD